MRQLMGFRFPVFDSRSTYLIPTPRLWSGILSGFNFPKICTGAEY